MYIIESNKYKRSLKRLQSKHLDKELRIIDIIMTQLYLSKSLQDFFNSSLKYKYNIEQKKGTLKEYIPARLNGHTRLIMKPVSDYPYNYMEIVEIEFVDINEKHYKK